MTETVLGLLRHGQTDWNIDFRLQGITDIPMNATGHQQAAAAARAIDTETWEVLLTSPLTRAIETATAVQKKFVSDGKEIQLIQHSGLLERSFGSAEGLTYDEWRNSSEVDQLAAGAETMMSLQARAEEYLRELAETYRGRRVLAVSHGALIRTFIGIASAENLPPAGERISNACFNVLKHSEAGWEVLVYEPAPLTESLRHRFEIF